MLKDLQRIVIRKSNEFLRINAVTISLLYCSVNVARLGLHGYDARIFDHVQLAMAFQVLILHQDLCVDALDAPGEVRQLVIDLDNKLLLHRFHLLAKIYFCFAVTSHVPDPFLDVRVDEHLLDDVGHLGTVPGEAFDEVLAKKWVEQEHMR